MVQAKMSNSNGYVSVMVTVDPAFRTQSCLGLAFSHSWSAVLRSGSEFSVEESEVDRQQATDGQVQRCSSDRHLLDWRNGAVNVLPGFEKVVAHRGRIRAEDSGAHRIAADDDRTYGTREKRMFLSLEHSESS